MVEREHRGGNEERGRLERSWFLSLRHGFLCSFENWRRRWSTCLLHSSAIHLLCSDRNAYKDSMGTNRSRLRGPRARNWSGRAPLFSSLPTFSSVTMRADENVQPFLLSLTEPLSPSVSPKTAASFLFNGIRGGKETKKELAQSQLDACFLSLFFTKMAPQQLASQPRRWRQRSQEDCQDLARARAPPRRLGPRRRLAHPWRNHAAAEGSSSQETSSTTTTPPLLPLTVQENTERRGPHSHEPASGMGSRPPTQPPPLPYPQQAARGLPAAPPTGPPRARAAAAEPSRSTRSPPARAATRPRWPRPPKSPPPPRQPQLAPARPPQPPQPRSQHPLTPEQHRAQRQQEREIVHEAAHTPMDPEWRRLVRRGFVPASGFRRGGREGGGTVAGKAEPGRRRARARGEGARGRGDPAPGRFQAPETLSVAARDSAIAASVADVLGVPRSSVAVAEAASDGSDAKAPPAAAAAAAAEKPAARREPLAGLCCCCCSKASSPTPAAASPAVAAAAPAAAAKAPAAASPAPAAAAKAPAAASPAPAAAAPAPKPAAAAAAAAPAAAPPPASSSLPALKDVIVRVDDQKTGSGGALAKKLAAAAADGTLAKALRSRGFTGADGDATAVGASIAADPTEATWRDRLPFPFWAFIAIVAGAGGLLLLSLLATLVFCCCCTPLMRAARRERSEERKRVKAEAAAAKVAANAELGAQGKGGDDVESGNVKNRRAVAPAPGAALNKDGSAPVDVSSTIKLLRDYAGELQMGGNGAAVVAAAAGAVAATGAAATAAAAASPAALDARALAATKRSHLPPAPRLDDEEETIPGTPSAAAAAAAAAGEHSSVSDADEAASVLASPRSLALPSRELTARLDAANARLAAYVGSLTVKTAAPVVAQSAGFAPRARRRSLGAAAGLGGRGRAPRRRPRARRRGRVRRSDLCCRPEEGEEGGGEERCSGSLRRRVCARRDSDDGCCRRHGVRGVGDGPPPLLGRRGRRHAGSSGAPVDITLFVDGSEFESARTFASVARDAEFVPTVLEIEPPGALVPGDSSAAILHPSRRWPASSPSAGATPWGSGSPSTAWPTPSTSSRDLGSPVVPAQAARVALVHSLEALAYLHARGLCHRDVTPDTLKWHDAGRQVEAGPAQGLEVGEVAAAAARAPVVRAEVRGPRDGGGGRALGREEARRGQRRRGRLCKRHRGGRGREMATGSGSRARARASPSRSGPRPSPPTRPRTSGRSASSPGRPSRGARCSARPPPTAAARRRCRTSRSPPRCWASGSCRSRPTPRCGCLSPTAALRSWSRRCCRGLQTRGRAPCRR